MNNFYNFYTQFFSVEYKNKYIFEILTEEVSYKNNAVKFKETENTKKNKKKDNDNIFDYSMILEPRYILFTIVSILLLSVKILYKNLIYK